MKDENPELNLLNKYEYDAIEVRSVKVYFSKEKSEINIHPDELDKVLEIIPSAHLLLIPRIYVVSYFCQDCIETKGRHLAGLNYIVLYPNSVDKLKEVLIHEVGHLIWDRKLNPQQRIEFYYLMLKEVPATLNKNDKLEKYIFVLENFANSYLFYLLGIFDEERYPNIYKFISSL
ncbi:MAG: hypothetical protein AB1668_01535 [Nanoarchaeota archaeon]